MIQIDHLLSEVKQSFIKKLERAKRKLKESTFYKDELANFAKHCVENGIHCITFNYDDVFDQALYETKTNWHPDGGYGFFCKPSFLCIRDKRVEMDITSMLLLKLHGSVNWRIRLGYSPPYSIDAIVHDEEWLPHPYGCSKSDPNINLHLEKDPFIVPPVLVKSSLVEQPILRLIWSLAYEKLKEADQITFVGYSLPVTDIAAGFLFGEGIRKIDNINVVIKTESEKEQIKIRNAYRNVFPKIRKRQFDFRDAREWAREIVGKDA